MATNAEVIHLVHPDSQVLLVLYEFLSAAGYQVAGSSNCLQALAHIARIRPNVVLGRLEMPEMEARMFLERIRHVSPETRIILASVHADPTRHREVRSWGGDELLPEPFHLVHVLQALDQAVGRDRSSEISVGQSVGIAPRPARMQPGSYEVPVQELPGHE